MAIPPRADGDADGDNSDHAVPFHSQVSASAPPAVFGIPPNNKSGAVDAVPSNTMPSSLLAEGEVAGYCKFQSGPRTSGNGSEGTGAPALKPTTDLPPDTAGGGPGTNDGRCTAAAPGPWSAPTTPFLLMVSAVPAEAVIPGPTRISASPGASCTHDTDDATVTDNT